ncbi:MAG: helix-turn-helix domain-containing protein [Burkholderiaceae bacterium]|jgi:hypothetical protein|nr:helix-turn-helix domain-containing protein [Burkholderiales bacterium]MCZ8105970.1 helix-turn-helix domain-containing protein [Burkholderiales bacterium]MCZ8340266.1 helix-turn-helix domain-containing protein [Burkholderiaceae bacterium]
MPKDAADPRVRRRARRTAPRVGHDPEPHALPDPDRAPQPDPLDAAYSILAFTMNRCVVDQMLRSARQFGGDYERLILWGVVAHLNVAHLMPPGSLPSSVLDPHGLVPGASERLRPVRTSDLAQITGIPRETVRRKLGALERDGWIRQDDAGWFLDVERLDPSVRAFTLQSIRNFLQAARTMDAAIADATPAAVSGSRTARSAAAPPTARTTGARRSRPPPRRG